METIFGYRFKNAALLEEALTTPSFRMTNPAARDNQRLEFLGDAVLGFLAADALYRECPNDSEGPLTVRRTHRVSSAALCEVAARHDLARRLKRNKGATELPRNAKTLADAVEAVIGAAWLDGGLAAAQAVYAGLELAAVEQAQGVGENPKGDLQVKVQAMVPPRHPEYTLLSATGKSHEPVFTVRVSVDGVGEATASAHSHKEAESLAAARLLATVR